jgi:hypothetical protein
LRVFHNVGISFCTFPPPRPFPAILVARSVNGELLSG